MRTTLLFGLVFAFIAFPAVAPGQTQNVPVTQSGPARRPLRLAVSGEISGQLATPDCRGTRAPALIAGISSLIAGAGDALAIDGGNLVGSAALSRMAVERNPAAVADTIVAMGLRALALGHADLAAPRANLVAVARGLAERRAPYVLSNLGCFGTGAPLCEAVVDAFDAPFIVDTPFGRVAILAAVSPTAIEHVASDRTVGIQLLDPAASIARGVANARAQNADWVVAMYDPAVGNELPDAIALSRALDATHAPDVLVVERIGGSFGSALSVGGHTLIVATRPGGVVVVEPDKAVPTQPAPVGPAVAAVQAFSDDIARWLCETHFRQLPGGQITHPMSRDEFAALLLDVLRERSHAEVAVMNRGAVAARGLFPIEGALTRLHVMSAQPFDNLLRTALIRGPVLRAFALSAAAAGYYVRGLHVSDGHVSVNGRPLDETVEYTVITTDYVADRPDGALGSRNVHWTPSLTLSAREVLLRWLDQAHGADVTVAPRDPANLTRWTLRYVLDGAMTAVSIYNPSALNDAQLVRAQVFALRGDSEIRADADHPTYTFDNSLRVRYGVANTGPMGRLVENNDLIVARSSVALRRFRSGPRHWWAPHPYVELYTESELTRPNTPPISRPYHHLEMRPTTGARMELAERVSIYAGVGTSWEVLARPEQLMPPGPTAVPVFMTGYALRPGTVGHVAGRAVLAESFLDVMWRDPFGRQAVITRFGAKLAIPLFSLVSLTFSYDAFMRYALIADAANDGALVPAFGMSMEATIGLRVSYALALQGYVF